MFEDELEEALLKLRLIEERLDQQNPEDDREKLLRDQAELVALVGLDDDQRYQRLSSMISMASMLD